MAGDLSVQQKYDMFSAFAVQRGDTSTIAEASSDGKSLNVKKSHDFVGNIGRRIGSRSVNDATRTLFKQTLMGIFDVTDENDLPDSVKDVMKLEDYHGKGKPLTSRRILAVTKAADAVFDARLQPLVDEAARQGVPIDDDVRGAIRTAMRAYTGDADVMDAVKANIKGLLMDNGHLRAASDITERIGALVANVAELRQVAGGDADILAVGKKCLAGLGGDVLGAGQFRAMVDAAEAGAQKMGAYLARGTRIDGPRKLCLQIRELSRNLDEMLDACNAPGIRMDGPNRELNCRNFLVSLMLRKSGQGVVDDMAQLIRVDGGSLKKWCRDLSSALREEYPLEYPRGAEELFTGKNGKVPYGEREYLADLLDGFAKRLDQLWAALDWNGDNPVGVGEVKPQEYYGDQYGFLRFCRDLSQIGRIDSEQARHDFLRDVVRGNGASADLMRYVFSRKLNTVASHNPAETVKNICQDAIRRIVSQQVNLGAGVFATSAGKAAFEEGMRGANVMLPGRTPLSADFETARDQLASFVTKGAKARFADLSAGERNQVFCTMSLLTRGTANAAYDGPAIALNPLYNPESGTVVESMCQKAFNCPASPDGDRREIELSLDRDGGLVMNFDGSRDIGELQVLRNDYESYASIALDQQGHVEGWNYLPSSSMGSSFSLKIGADAFARGKGLEATDIVCSGFKLSPILNDRQPAPGKKPIRSIFPPPWDKLRLPGKGQRDEIKFELNTTPAQQLNSAIRLAEKLYGPFPVLERKPGIDIDDDGQ